jgi:hypothetical protein
VSYESTDYRIYRTSTAYSFAGKTVFISGIGTLSALGWQSESKIVPSRLTELTERAARANNEMGLPASMVE